jgi:hypothetical protein
MFMARIVCNFSNAPFQGLRRIARLGVIACMFAGLTACAWLDAKQRQLVFRPTPGVPAGFAGLRPGDLSFATAVPGAEPGARDSLQMWWLPHTNANAPTLLYLHGTFRNLYQNLPKIDALREAGFSVLAVDYRGWGDSTPLIPSESTIYADADVAWAELERRQPDPRKRVIYGHSMGGGVAVEMASRKHHGSDYGALILESTFTRAVDVADATNWLVGLAARFSAQKFDSLAKIGKVDAPVLMLHGAADHTVPVELGRQLRDAAPAGTRWVEIPGGSHSRLQSEAPETYQRALKLLIDGLG